MSLRVALITNGFPDLSEKFILNQVTGLMDAGIEVDVFAAYAPSQAIAHHLAATYGVAARTTYLNVPSSFRDRARQAPGLLVSGFRRAPGSVLRALRTDVYATAAKSLKTLYFLKAFAWKEYPIGHCHFGPNGLTGAFLKDIGAIGRLVVTFHGSDINSYPRRHGERVYATLYDRADIVTAGTRFMRDKLVRNGCPEQKIRVVPAGFRADELAPPPDGERSSFMILSVGRLHELKGHRFAIEAFARVRRSFPQAQYVIVGEGGLRRELQALAEQLGVADSVRFPGAMADHEVASMYRKASVLVMPSVRMEDGAEEGQGLVVQEAQACGLPVIASRIGGLPEGLADGVTGYLVPEKDSEAIAACLMRLLGDEALRTSMGRAGRDWVLPRYAVDVLIKRQLHIYEEILGTPRRAA